MELPKDFTVDAGILELEAKLGIPRDFFRHLLEEDDWSFVIKLHALFEAACTHLLLFHFKEPALAELFARIELSNRTTGKIMFLGKLGLLSKEDRRLISTLSELRNSLVHDVRNSEFSLGEMVGRLAPPNFKAFAIAFSPFEAKIRRLPYDPDMGIGYKADMQESASVDAVTERMRANPKHHIWLGAYNVLVSIVDMYGYSDYKQWTKAREFFDDEGAI